MTATLTANVIERELDQVRAKLSDRHSKGEAWSSRAAVLREAIGVAVADGRDPTKLRRELHRAEDEEDSLRRACTKLERDITTIERQLGQARNNEAVTTARALREEFAAQLAEAETKIVQHVRAIVALGDELSVTGQAATRAGFSADQARSARVSRSAADAEWSRLRKAEPGTAHLQRFLVACREYARQRGITFDSGA